MSSPATPPAYADRVRRRERFILTQDGEPIAELRPVPPTLRLGDLPELLERLPPLTDEERTAFAEDLGQARTDLMNEPLRDPWAS